MRPRPTRAGVAASASASTTPVVETPTPPPPWPGSSGVPIEFAPFTPPPSAVWRPTPRTPGLPHPRREARETPAVPYPPTCRPAAGMNDRFYSRPPPFTAALDGGALRADGVRVRITSDRADVFPEDGATVTVEAAQGDRLVPLEVTSASTALVPPMLDLPAEDVEFRDDGRAPDQTAGDNRWTAVVRAPAPRPGVDLPFTLTVNVTAGGRSGAVTYGLSRIAAPPARFTGNITETVVDGNVVFDIGVEVSRAGDYSIQGHLFDGRHRALGFIAVMTRLETSSRVVKLGACGKLLRDYGIPGPWELGDLEGWLNDVDHTPDRVPLRPWQGPHVTRAIPLTQLTDANYREAVPAPP